MSDMEFSIGGYNIKGWMVAVAIPVLSSVAGSVYFAYDALNRFYDTEAAVEDVLGVVSRVQTLEQAIQDNDVRGLNTKLAQLGTNMTQILEQQKVLLDLRSQVDKATTITSGLGDTLDTLKTEIDDIWKAYDELVDNPL
jgi:hypothetical protein